MSKQTKVTQFFELKPKIVHSSPIKKVCTEAHVFHRSKIAWLHFQLSSYQLNYTLHSLHQSQRQPHSLDSKKQIAQNLVFLPLYSTFRPYLPKFIIYAIYKFLTLRECVSCALVCKFWAICYNDIYFQYSFFREFHVSSYSERELATVLRRTSQEFKHIKNVKEMLKGQKLGAFLQKTELTSILSENSSQKGSLLEAFQLQPKKQQSSVFLTDKDLASICSESYKSLQYISLVGCQFMTGKGFEQLKQCRDLQFVNIQNNSLLRDENIAVFLASLAELRTLQLLQCPALTQQCLHTITQYCPKLQRLDLSLNPQLRLNDCSYLAKISYLRQLALREIHLEYAALEQIVDKCAGLETLNLEGAKGVNASYLGLLTRLEHLKKLNVRRITFSEPDIYSFVIRCKQLLCLVVNNNVYSTRIEKILVHR